MVGSLVSALDCQEGTTYVKIIKKNEGYSSEESFSISNSAGVLIQSITLTDDSTQTFEHCIADTPNSQYVLKMMDSYGDSWTSGAWIEIRGLYDNVVFKNMMTSYYLETYTLSLYCPIIKNAEWKMTTGATGTWMDASFSDSNWDTVILGSVTTQASGVQYFRKAFTGLAGMAAYETRLNYQAGIVAFVNGVEVYRDNITPGAISSSTTATGEYGTLAYRAFVRPATEVASTQSILAVAVYPMAASSPVDFNAFMAILASSAPEANCFVASEGVTVTSSVGNDGPYVFDFDRETSGSDTVSSANPVEVQMSYSNTTYFVNGLRIWPSTVALEAPKAFTWSGKNTEPQYTQIMNMVDVRYTPERDQYAYGFFNGGLYKNYKLVVTEAGGDTVYLYEVEPLVCALTAPQSVVFDPASYSVLANYDTVRIRPYVTDFMDCSISPALPAGLTLDAHACVVSGTPTAITASTTFTVTSSFGGQSYTGTFALEVKGCNDLIVDLRRVYSLAAGSEFFSIHNSANELVYAIQPSTTQLVDETVDTYVCLPQDEYTVTLASHAMLWSSESYLYVDVLFSETEKETVLRARFDSYFNIVSDSFSLRYPIPARSQWKYKMDQVPANWFNSDMSGWSEGSVDTFPDATTTIQLYKKAFTVATLENYAGFVLGLRYKFGCVVYLNNHEVFRNGVVGELSVSSVAENIYDDLMYRIVSLPLQRAATSTQAAVSHIVQGENVIAVAIVSTTSMKMSFFDCSLRLMNVDRESRVLEGYSVYSSSLLGSSYNVFDDCSDYSMYQSSCYTPSYLEIDFLEDRRECISTVLLQLGPEQGAQQPRSFVFQAHNKDNEEWVTLRTVTGMAWSQIGQAKRISIPNSDAYNKYRFYGFNNGAAECYWELGRVSLLASSSNQDIPDLKYVEPGETVSIYRNIEIAEIYPNSDDYSNFSVQPALPEGLVLDAASGMISGTTTVTMDTVVYTISATKPSGEVKTALLPLKVVVCTGGQSLITLVVRMDTWSTEGSYNLFEGRQPTGTPLHRGSKFAIPDGLNYADWCLADGIYTVEMYDSASDGWTNPAGWYMSVDVGAMRLDMGQMPRLTPSISATFSSYLPFQVEYSDWSVFKGQGVAANWKSADFDASAWESVKAAAIGTNQEITTYIRREFSIPSLDDYSVLNVRVKYTGGVVAYFNGVKVARFNLREDFDASTQSLEAKNEAVFSMFHVILNTVGAATDKNVIAFEMHRPKDQSSSEPVVFDATGVFGVSACSVVLDSYVSITEGYEDFFDVNPTSYKSLPNSVGASVEWAVENLEGARFNGYAWQTSTAASGLGFSLYARASEEDDFLSALAVLNQTALDRGRVSWSVPVGVAGFRFFKYTADTASSSAVSVNGMLFLYCKVSGAVCPGVDNYPPVSEGQISPASCAEGFHGYAYRECANGVLGEVKTDKCVYNLPGNMTYGLPEYTFVVGTEVSTGRPTYKNIITEFSLDSASSLPAGVSLDPTTGVISGVPTAPMDKQEVIIHGTNPQGATFVKLMIFARKGFCYPEGSFPLTYVGEEATYDCALDGNYVGTRSRACVLGTKDGEWMKAKGFCASVMLIVVLVVVVVVIIVVAIFLLMRVTKKRKAVGGKKSAKVTKVPKEKKNEKKQRSVRV